MEPSEPSPRPTAPASNSRGAAIRILKWIAIVLVLLFLVTRVIRFFLQ